MAVRPPRETEKEVEVGRLGLAPTVQVMEIDVAIGLEQRTPSMVMIITGSKPRLMPVRVSV